MTNAVETIGSIFPRRGVQKKGTGVVGKEPAIVNPVEKAPRVLFPASPFGGMGPLSVVPVPEGVLPVQKRLGQMITAEEAKAAVEANLKGPVIDRSRREFLALTGVIAATLVMLGAGVSPERKRKPLYRADFVVGDGWGTGMNAARVEIHLMDLEEYLAEQYTLRCFEVNGNKGVFRVDNDAGGVLLGDNTGGTVVGNRIILNTESYDREGVDFNMVFHLNLFHESIHALGNILPRVLGGDRWGDFLTEAPAHWFGAQHYTSRIDAGFAEARMADFRPVDALGMSKESAQALAQENRARLCLGWENLWRMMENEAKELGHAKSLMLHIRERYRRNYPGGGSPNISDVFRWGQEWCPSFIKVMDAPISQTQFYKRNAWHLPQT